MAVIARNGGGLRWKVGGACSQDLVKGVAHWPANSLPRSVVMNSTASCGDSGFRLFLLRSGGQFLRFQVDHAQDVGRADAAAQGFGVDGGS